MPPPRPPSSPGLALVLLAGAQFLIVVDATIVTVALSDIQRDLAIESARLQWVMTAYVLPFGAGLLLAGRLADRYGRRRFFIAGASVLAAASAWAGFADTELELFLGRGVQGVAAAMLAPAALSLLMVVFPPGDDRIRALAVWGAVSAGGAAAGLLLGGLLTQLLTWEWVLFVNVPVATTLALAARHVLPVGGKDTRERFDLVGAMLATAGLLALVYGLVETSGAGSLRPVTALTLVGAAVLLAAFGYLQVSRPYALIPARVLRSSSVLGANIVAALLGTAIYALFFFLSLFMGAVLDLGAIAVGLGFLPMAGAIAVASAVASSRQVRVGHRRLLMVATFLVSLAMLCLTQLDPTSSYLGAVLPALLVAGSGLGLAFVSLTGAAVGAVPASDHGVAAALFNTSQQVGGAVGLAVISSISATGAQLAGNSVMTSGWKLGFMTAAGLMALALAATSILIADLPAVD